MPAADIALAAADAARRLALLIDHGDEAGAKDAFLAVLDHGRAYGMALATDTGVEA